MSLLNRFFEWFLDRFEYHDAAEHAATHFFFGLIPCAGIYGLLDQFGFPTLGAALGVVVGSFFTAYYSYREGGEQERARRAEEARAERAREEARSR